MNLRSFKTYKNIFNFKNFFYYSDDLSGTPSRNPNHSLIINDSILSPQI